MRRLLLGVCLACSAPVAQAGAWQEALAACVAEQTALTPFNGVLAAGKGAERYQHAQGWADADGQRPLGRDTPFRLASVGKLFTRVALGVLIQQGRLQLSDSVRSWLPELPERFAPITLAQLLEHRAGVAAMTRPDPADAPTLAAATTARALVPLIAAKPLSFAPDQGEAYSNGGYLLLGAVIEAASGQRYREFVAASVFAPLGMKSSGFEPGPEAALPLTRLTGPGEPPAAKPRPRMEFPEFKASSAGDALSSAADLEAFAQALLGDQFLSAAVKATVFPRRSSPWRLGQAGGSAGSNTGFWVEPEAGRWLLVLSNFDPPGG